MTNPFHIKISDSSSHLCVINLLHITFGDPGSHLCVINLLHIDCRSLQISDIENTKKNLTALVYFCAEGHENIVQTMKN